MQECSNSTNSMCMIYVCGAIGAAVYFISKATGFWMGVVGFFKAIVWPAYLVYGAFNMMNI